MNLILIATMDRRGNIGHHIDSVHPQNQMLGIMPNWFENIKIITRLIRGRSNIAVAVGRNTANLIGLLECAIFDDIPNIVLSRRLSELAYEIEGVSIISGLPLLRTTCKSLDAVFVIGGHSTYSRLIEHASELWLYEVDADLQGTLKFPSWDKSLYELHSRASMPAQSGFPHECSFAKYRLRSLSSGTQGSLF